MKGIRFNYLFDIVFAISVLLVGVVGLEDPFKNVQNPSKIMGGYNFIIAQAPFTVSLQFLRQHTCGGCLIRNNLVLTAAHCFEGKMKKQNWMVLLRSTDNRASEQLIDVLRIIPHRRFDGITLNYDVAIVVLKSEPDMYKHPISVINPSPISPPINSYVFTIGWGATGPNSRSYWPTLRGTWFVVFPFQKCQSIYNYTQPKTLFCAGAVGDRDGACERDSGGPVILSQRVVVGIVSQGSACDNPKHVGVYTNVSELYPWIKKVIDKRANVTKTKK